MAATDWQYAPVSFVLPPAASATLRGRIPAGDGDGRAARIAVRRLGGGAGAPVGTLFVRWDTADGLATVHRIGWDAANGGSELAVRRAVAQLRGDAPA